MRRFIATLAVVASMMIVGCTNSGPLGANRHDRGLSNLDASVLIKLPSSIALEQQGTALGKRAANDDATPYDAIELYDGIRAWVGLADELVNNGEFGVRALILAWRDALDWGYIEQVGEVSASDNGYRWTGSYGAARQFPYHLTVQKLTSAGEPVALKIEFNGDFSLPSGQVYYHVDLLDSSVTNNVQVLVEFAKTTAQRSLDVSITADAVTGPDDEDFQNGKISMREVNGIVHISGCSFHPNIDSILAGVVGHCYTFTGVVDTTLNQAIVKLGLPPATYSSNDNALFTTYGLSELFSQVMIGQEIPKLGDSLKSFIVTSYKDSLPLDTLFARLAAGVPVTLHPAADAQSMTVDDYVSFLRLNQTIADPDARADFAVLLWIAKLDQPVYFWAQGYMGNGATVPVGFDNLAAVNCMLDPMVPSSIRDLTIQQP